MCTCEKEQALLQILQDLLFIDGKLTDTTIYYFKFTRKINGINQETCLFDIIHSILDDYKSVILKDFYNELEQSKN